MRFIWNFFFFGILFYLIWLVFPETFMTLVSWANQVVSFFRELITGVVDKVQHQTAPVSAPAEHVKSMIMNFFGR